MTGAFDPLAANDALFLDEISLGPQNVLRSWKRATTGVGTEGWRIYGVGPASVEWPFAGAEWDGST